MGMIRALAVVAVLGLLVLLHGCPPPCAAARPLARGATSSEEEVSSSSSWSTLAVAPSASNEDRAPQWRTDGAARAGKWLPFAGAAHARYPALWGFPAAAGAAPALVFRTGGQLMEEPHEHEDAATRQEQVAMWASLLNPTQVRPAPAWVLAENGGEAPPADAEPTAEGMDVDEPPATGGMLFGQPKWPGTP